MFKEYTLNFWNHERTVGDSLDNSKIVKIKARNIKEINRKFFKYLRKNNEVATGVRYQVLEVVE